MQLSQTHKHNAFLFSLVGAVTTWRIATYFIEHGNGLLSLSPMYAVMLFSAACFRGPKSLIVPLAALFLSDVILCFTVYAPFRSGLLYNGWYWVYAAFVLASLACNQVLKRLTVARLMTSLFVTSLIHWVIATLSFCTEQSQPGDFVQTYSRLLLPALGYEWKLLAGTLLYGVILFGVYYSYRKIFSSRLTA
jgi:hypothetical protein